MNKVVCAGECLIDFLPVDGELNFAAKPGGAPANVCACVAKLGAPAYFLGRLSTDMFGRFLSEKLSSHGVMTDYVVYTDAPTALAFVKLEKNGEREFSFYRTGTADLSFCEDDVPPVFSRGDIFHFCSVALVESPSKYAHKKAAISAAESGATVSFDVNLRLNLWENTLDCINTVKEFLPYADLVKAADDEARFLTGEEEELKSVAELFKLAPRAKLLYITKGAQGAAVYDRALNCVNEPSVKTVVVDTTGAGDCFIGCVLYCIVASGKELSIENGSQWLNYALKGAAKAVSAKGAMEAMPSYGDIF